ncbi:MAG: insulinase family protein, partial [Phaeodactylibacter sp.]|nr:insulinase family protein [Phaeodactylibacter sp.]
MIDASAQEFRKTAPQPGPAPDIQMGDYERFSLENGLDVIVVENHKLPRVSFQVYVDAPLIDEGDAAGYLSLAGQMLTQGTNTRSKAEIDEAVDFIGASLSSSSSGLYGACLTKHKNELLGIMQEVLMQPSFPEEQFEKLKKQTLSGLAQAKEDPNAIASNVASVLRYGEGHPYGRIETEASIQKLTLDQCKSYYQDYFKPNTSYLVVVGDIKPEEAKALAKQYFGSWKKGTIKSSNFATPEKPDEARVAFVDKAGAVQSVINITYAQELDLGDPNRLKVSVMNTALGGYFRSRLNNNLREDKGYTYGAGS